MGVKWSSRNEHLINGIGIIPTTRELILSDLHLRGNTKNLSQQTLVFHHITAQVILLLQTLLN